MEIVLDDSLRCKGKWPKQNGQEDLNCSGVEWFSMVQCCQYIVSPVNTSKLIIFINRFLEDMHERLFV